MGLILAPLLRLASAVPLWAWALAAALAWGGWQRHQVRAAAAELASQQAQAAHAREEGLRESIHETERRLAAQNQVSKDAQDQLDQARAAAGAAAAAAGRLRARVAAVQAGATADHPTPAGHCTAAQDAARMFAELFSSADDRAGLLAAEADAARVAGTACERAYDALTAP